MDENRRDFNTSSTGTPTAYGTSSGLFGETDRDSGEYHFRSGYTHQVYSNAHYVPEKDSTEPPIYFRPNYEEQAPGEKNKELNRKKKRGGSGFILALILCFFCALLGGGVASYLTAQMLTGSGLSFFTAAKNHIMDTSDTADSSNDGVTEQNEETADEKMLADEELKDAEPTPEPTLLPSEVYSIACAQVVSIGTDIINIDRYGNQIPAMISGTGFIVSEDGYIMTNYHVVEHAINKGINVTVTAFDGTVYIGSVISYDYSKDLAVVKIEASGLYPAELGDSNSVCVGDPIYAVGNPYGVLDFTMSIGSVSALNRIVATSENEENANVMFQIDASVYSGNSGGPAYDRYGRVIGIVSAKYLEDGMEGIGFVIPINDVLPFIYELLDKGYVGGRASLGAFFDENYNTVLSRYYRLPEGAYIAGVTRGGCSERAGLRTGDIIMKIGSYTIDSYDDIPIAIRNFKAGETVEVVIFRDGTLYAASLILDEEIPDGSAESLRYYLPAEST